MSDAWRREERSRAYLLKLRHHNGLVLALQLDQALRIEVEVEPGVRNGEDVAKEGLLRTAVVKRQPRSCDGGRNKSEEGEELHGGRGEDVVEGKRVWDDAASTTESATRAEAEYGPLPDTDST